MVNTSDLRRHAGAACAALAIAWASASAAGTVAQVDAPAPEVDVRLINGKLLKAKDLRGQVVVQMIWATWSPAARMELPEVQKLYAAHRSRGLEVVALSIDEEVAEVREFWRKRQYSMPVGMRSDAFFEHYGRVSTTPMFYIVDRRGTLRHRIAGPLGPEKLAALLQPLLAEPVPERFAQRR
jgi:peroxiredoxin